MHVADTLLWTMQAMAGSTGQSPSTSSPEQAGTKDTQFRELLQQKHQDHSSTKDVPAEKPAPDPQSKSEQQVTEADAKPQALQQELAASMLAPPILSIVPEQLPPVEPAVTVTVQPLAAQATPTVQAVAVAHNAPTEAPPAAVQSQAAHTPPPLQHPAQATPLAEAKAAPAIPQQAVQAVESGSSQTQLEGQTKQTLPGQVEVKEQQATEAPLSKPLFASIEHPPVKVGETPLADSKSPDFDQNLAKQINQTLAQGGQKLTIQLTPEHLGTLVVDLTRAQDGSLQLVLHTTTAKAANLLQEHSATLASLLRGSTQAPVYIQVQQQESQQQQQQDGGRQQQHSGQQQQQQQEQRHTQDFLEQLRLGIISLNSVAAS